MLCTVPLIRVRVISPFRLLLLYELLQIKSFDNRKNISVDGMPSMVALLIFFNYSVMYKAEYLRDTIQLLLYLTGIYTSSTPSMI